MLAFLLISRGEAGPPDVRTLRTIIALSGSSRFILGHYLQLRNLILLEGTQ